MYAVKNGQWKIMKYLLGAERIDVNIKNNRGNTALIIAAFNDRPSYAKKLIEKGANIKAKNHRKRTAWQEAANLRKLKMMKVLLEKGDNINQVTGAHGWCALHTAVEKNDSKMVSWLIEKKAKTDIKIKSGGNKGLTPRELAEKLNREKLLNILP